jgi:hypothetical protein
VTISTFPLSGGSPETAIQSRKRAMAPLGARTPAASHASSQRVDAVT